MIQRYCAYQPKHQDETIRRQSRPLDRLQRHVSLYPVLYTAGLRAAVRLNLAHYGTATQTVLNTRIMELPREPY
jgi:hypothetical protein